MSSFNEMIENLKAYEKQNPDEFLKVSFEGTMPRFLFTLYRCLGTFLQNKNTYIQGKYIRDAFVVKYPELANEAV